jgi:hypothetical protein
MVSCPLTWAVLPPADLGQFSGRDTGNATAAEDHYHMNAIHYGQQEQSSGKVT